MCKGRGGADGRVYKAEREWWNGERNEAEDWHGCYYSRGTERASFWEKKSYLKRPN